MLVQNAEEAEMIAVEDPERVAFLMQTTLAVDEAEETAGVLRRRFPSIASSSTDDICFATTNRQQAVRPSPARPTWSSSWVPRTRRTRFVSSKSLNGAGQRPISSMMLPRSAPSGSTGA